MSSVRFINSLESKLSSFVLVPLYLVFTTILVSAYISYIVLFSGNFFHKNTSSKLSFVMKFNIIIFFVIRLLKLIIFIIL